MPVLVCTCGHQGVVDQQLRRRLLCTVQCVCICACVSLSVCLSLCSRPYAQDGDRAFKVVDGEKIFTAEYQGVPCTLKHGSLLVASVTNCTNGSHPSTMLTAGKRMRPELGTVHLTPGCED